MASSVRVFSFQELVALKDNKRAYAYDFVLTSAFHAEESKVKDRDKKLEKARDLVKSLTFTPHSVHCVPSRCSCYLKTINELREVLK